MSMDEQQAFLYDVDGRQTAVAHGAREQFERDHPGANRLQLFDEGPGRPPRVVAQAAAEEYRRSNPSAQPVYLFDVDGRPRAVAKSALGGFLEEARAKEQARIDGPRPEKKSVARDLLDVAASRAGAAGLGVATAPGELLGGVASAVGGVDRSTPEGRALREHQERGDTWNGVTQSWDRAQPTISADRRSWARRQWDAVRGGVVRANQNFNDALVELGHGLRDWREGTKAAPTTIAGEVVAPVADTAATLGKYALLAPTGLGGGVMAAEGASESLARTEGRTDLSATDRLALAAAGGAANAAIYGAAGARATAPVSEAILRRASSGAAGQLVSGGGARMAADALKMGAASAAGDIAAAEPVDVRRAAQAAQEGALIGFASGAAASAPRAIEASARETARRMMDPATEAARLREAAEARYVEAQRGRAAEAASELAGVNPAATLGRIADEIPADLARAGENLEAAAVPESPMDAYARRRSAEADPLTDYAGGVGREFLERGARDLERREADAARLAEEELATREAPQVAPEEVPPTVAPEVRGGVQTPPPAEAPVPQSEKKLRAAEIAKSLKAGTMWDDGKNRLVSELMELAESADNLRDFTDIIDTAAAESGDFVNRQIDAAASKAYDRFVVAHPDAESELSRGGVDTTPRRVTGRPRELSTMHENGNSTTLATVKNRAEKGVLPVEIVVRPNGMGVSRAGQFNANEPVVLFRYESDGADSLGYPVFGNTERILEWAKESGLADKAGVSTVEAAPVAKSPTPPRAKLPEEVAHDKAEAARQEAVAALEQARQSGDFQAVVAAMKKVQSAARKEDNARKKMEAAVAKATTPPQEQAAAPEIAPEDQATVPGVDGNPRAVPGFLKPEPARVKKGAYAAVTNGERGVSGNVYYGEIVSVGPKNIKIRSKNDFYKSEHVLTFPRSQILGIEADPGAMERRSSSGSARGDVAAEAPRLAETARPATAGTRPATPDGPREALRQELKVMMDAGATGTELDAFAQRAEAADAFATAALARQAAGTYRGSPWNTEGGNWPHEEPPAARASFGDLFTLARNLGEGKAPEFVRRISRLPWAEGVFRFQEGEPGSGRIQERSGLLRLVPDARIEAIRSEATAEAAAKGLSPEQAQALFSRKLRSAIQESAFAGPKPAMAVLAHEIGHWVDFLDEGTLKRGNVLGHIAALKKWAGHQIFPSKAAADAAGAPGVTDAIVKARAEEWGVSKAEARRRLAEGADLQALPDLRREMESLVAWYRQSDGAPDYFRNDPAELYAEAFSAWVNYPAETARRAPAFASTMDGWLDARPKAAAALREFRDGVTQAEARATRAAGDTTNPAFFAALDQDQAAARRAEELADRLTDKALAERSFGGMAEDAHARIKVALTGADDILKGELMRSPLGAFNAHNLPLWRAMQQKDNANNRMVLWDYRYRTFVEPLLSGVPRPTFLNFLYHSRVAHELLGPDATRGRMNLPNADGLTPGDVTRAEGNAQTSSAAWLNELRRTQLEVYEKCERARREFWSKVRNGGDELGGEGSPMDVVRNSPCLSAEQKAALLGNEWYVAFRPAMVPDVSRPVASGEMSVWDGIFSQRTGSEKPVGDVLANTLLQDLTMQDQLLRQEYRLRAVDWLRANKAEWVGAPAAVTVDPATGRRSVAQREKPGWRVVAFLRDGKPEGWWVRDFIADALAPKPHQRTSTEPFRNALNASARGINALKTTMNPAFGVANTLKDAFSIALRQLPRDTSGLGHAQALLAGVQNWIGDYGAMMRSFRDNSAADLVRGRWNAETARALAWGALNNAAPNQSAYAGGGERGGVGDIAARYREEGRSEISDADLRRAMKTFGYTERQISDALDRTEGPLARALRAAGRYTGARWLAERHGDLMAFLSRGEIRTKSFALAEARRRRPDLTREELVQWTHDMIGTPAMNNRPTVAKLPGIGHLVPFLTPRVHGWTDQLFGALRTGWTGGPGRSAQVASRIAFTTAMMSIPLAAVGILRGEAEEAEKAGDKERADELRRMARRWQAIPSSDILSGICFPDPTSATRHVKIPVDPTIIPMAGLALEAIFGGKDLPKGAGAERFTGDLLPTMGTAPTLLLGNKTGSDPNTGRAVIGERTPGLDRALWNWDQLTARGLGMLPGSMLRAWMVGQEDAREIEKAGRADKTPFVSALWRPFLRRSGYGLVERAGAMRDADAADSRRATAIAERVVQGREVPAEDLEWFGANVASPGESLRAAALRMQRLRTMAPDERAAATLPVRRRERIEREAGYIAPPRLTDEDRAR